VRPCAMARRDGCDAHSIWSTQDSDGIWRMQGASDRHSIWSTQVGLTTQIGWGGKREFGFA
jgi:hypothetical protein